MTVTEIKRPGPNLQNRVGRIGGNRKWQTFKICQCCGREFGPVTHLRRRFCSQACKIKAQMTGRLTFRKTNSKARATQNHLRYSVSIGKLIRPDTCEQCGKTKCRIEAAHYNYDFPLMVRWLCVSCHRKWDKEHPKNATYTLPIRH